MINIESRYNLVHSLLSNINLNDSVENEIQEIIDTYIKKYMIGKKIAFRCTGAHSMRLLKNLNSMVVW